MVDQAARDYTVNKRKNETERSRNRTRRYTDDAGRLRPDVVAHAAINGGLSAGGAAVPPPYAYLVDDDGAYLVDSDGAYLFEYL